MNYFTFDERIIRSDSLATERVKEKFKEIDDVTEFNQQKVLSAFMSKKVAATDFCGSTGYGYDDIGRDKLDKVVAKTFGAEDALLRHTFASGTHTLSVALFGVLRPGDKVLCITGRPYDTITNVFGIGEETDGSLKDFNIEYNQIDLLEDGTPDINAIKSELSWKKYKMAYIQRSKGYSLRKSLTINDIKALCDAVREVSKDTVIMVDNCYGEFVETKEPTEVGADLMAGSLIKNPGGGIAPCGGYIAGRKDLIEKCAHRMTCAGVGREVGATLGVNRELYLGFFSAPHVTGEALKTAVYSAALLELMHYKVSPRFDEERGDIIECITLSDRNKLISFCKGLQSASPVDSFVSPEPSYMPGYKDDVIMAAGAFTLGSSIELSADAPLRPPFTLFMQGGINFHSAKAAILSAVQQMYRQN